ncbi:OmpP1/FadL family transporter [[Flexibacter] sp. ATCC 35208]|uniref:OmpP1/FadL family transporter n=1 Tax=[Flexibacter] sp. ATCC 35208 TaxID=1936242 RepID=UPI0009C7830E|nr:hypothetical protein [[Flexibacter] sp. ATCC 35208]OMP77096.1 hypothetical protein BW716_21890 [[Flexibacter] sp. ATCC 35208]
MMKRMVLAIAMTGACFSLQAQNIDDALRFSSGAPSGTARAQAVGGAQGALGGEASSMYINPATVGFFRTSDFSFTVGVPSISSTGTYQGVSSSDSRTNLNISNATIIWGGKRKKPGSKWQNFSGGIGVNRTSNYNQRTYYTGDIHNSSLSLNYYLAADAAGITNPNAQLGGDPDQTILAHSSALAYQTYLINPVTNTDGSFAGTFYSAAEATDNSVYVRQESTSFERGANTEFAGSFGANYNDKFYIGGGIGVPNVQYRRDLTWKETNLNTLATDLNYFTTTEVLRTYGTGINAKLGIIYRPVKTLNLGATIHTPSWIWLTDEYHTDMTTSTKSNGVNSFSSRDSRYDGLDDESKYTVRTPWKGILSATYLFAPSADTRKPTGFISVDYEYVDYASMHMRFKNNDGYDRETETDRNNSIKDTYQAASNFRVGGELKLHTIALRLGYSYYGSPYKISSLDGVRSYYSGGIGYRNNGFYMDLAFIYGSSTSYNQPYTMLANNMNYVTPDAAKIEKTSYTGLATFGWKF